MKQKKIIGFTGQAGAGKDTCADIIMNTFESVELLSITEPLKKSCQILFNLTNEQLHDTIIKETVDPRWNKSPRELFQWLGTDIIRNTFDPDFFVKNVEQRIMNSTNEYIVISDIRFNNEAKMIKSLGGKIIKIDRKDYSINSTHESENGIDHSLIDVYIANDSSILQLEKRLSLLINHLF